MCNNSKTNTKHNTRIVRKLPNNRDGMQNETLI